jgi:hypothetical protein
MACGARGRVAAPVCRPRLRVSSLNLSSGLSALSHSGMTESWLYFIGLVWYLDMS